MHIKSCDLSNSFLIKDSIIWTGLLVYLMWKSPTLQHNHSSTALNAVSVSQIWTITAEIFDLGSPLHLRGRGRDVHDWRAGCKADPAST